MFLYDDRHYSCVHKHIKTRIEQVISVNVYSDDLFEAKSIFILILIVKRVNVAMQ